MTRGDALVLFPGAGGDRSHPSFLAIDAALAPLGAVVERVDFPYRLAGRRAPDRPPVLLAAVREAAEACVRRHGVAPERVVLGGRSMGGRIASVAVAQGLPAAGLVLIAYPLRPPGRPEKIAERTQHLPAVEVPCLFVSGTKDSFGTPGELAAATDLVAGEVQRVEIEGKGHELKGADRRVAEAVAAWWAGPRPPG